MAPVKSMFDQSLSPPTMWGIGTYAHPLKTLNMERSREEEDEQMRRGGEDRTSQSRVPTVHSFGVFEPTRRKGEIRGPNYTEPPPKPQPLETTTYFLRFRVGGATGRRDGCHSAQITLGKREKKGGF